MNYNSPYMMRKKQKPVTSRRSAKRSLKKSPKPVKRAKSASTAPSPLDGLRYVLEDLDMVLLMTVNPGFGGQSFITNVVPKIRELRAEVDRRKL